MKVLERKKVTLNVTLPCDICGKRTRTVRIWLNDRTSRRSPPGFYSYDLIHLCEKCVDKIKASLG